MTQQFPWFNTKTICKFSIIIINSMQVLFLKSGSFLGQSHVTTIAQSHKLFTFLFNTLLGLNERYLGQFSL